MKNQKTTFVQNNRWFVLGLLVVFLMVITACGSSETGSDGSGDSDVSALPTQSEADIVIDPEQLAESATTFDPSITDGETLFISYCAKCHGLGGLGDGPSAGSLSSQAGMNLTILQDRTDEEIFNTISGGKNVEMPPWGLVLTVEQRESLVQYVRSLGSE